MRLFIDGHLFDGFGQGTKTYLGGLYHSVFRRCPDVEFSMGAFHPEKLAEEFGTLTNVKYLPYASANKFKRLALDIPRLIQQHKIDMAHFQYVSPLQKTCKEIVTIHDILFLDFPQYFPLTYRLSKNFLFRRSALRADWVLTVSEYSKKALVRNYRMNDQKIVITPNGVLETFFNPETGTSGIAAAHDQFILYVSRFEPRKNQHDLLKAFCELELWKKGLQLVFVGAPGVHSPRFEKLYHSLPEMIREHIFIYTDLAVGELKALYKKCLLFVYPSFAEGFGIPPLEAAACGAPVLCSNATAMSEFDFFGDRLYDPLDYAGFKDRLLYFLSNSPTVLETERIRTLVKTRYSWEKSAEIFAAAVLKRDRPAT